MQTTWLYRATAPSVRAQSIQVVNSAHAWARRGHQVTLALRAATPGVTPEAVLSFYGLAPCDTLQLEVLPASGTLASVAHRASFVRWARRSGGEGVVIARSKRYAQQALRWLPGRFRLVLEVHEVDSLLAAERGEDPAPIAALEAALLSKAQAVIANAPGTLELLERAHGPLPPSLVAHNGTQLGFGSPGAGEGIGYVGSGLASKDLHTLRAAAARLPWPITLVGAKLDDPGALRLEPALPPTEVGARLARFRVLVLPLSDGLFGAQLSSPLKLWDYLASGVPIVGADLPSLHAAAPGAFAPYRPGDVDDLVRVLRWTYQEQVVRDRLQLHARVRSWAERANEIEAFLAPLGLA